MREKPEAAPLLALLEWYCAAGVDACVAEVATNWLARADRPPGFSLAADSPLRGPPTSPAILQASSERPQSTQPGTTVPLARRLPTVPPDDAVLAARTAAQAAGTLDELEQTLRRFDGCALKATAKNLCFYRGRAPARVMIIGEAPGRDEDLEGKPFVGRAGQLLDKMLAAIALDDVHIANIVYWRPPGNRTPTPFEAQVCQPFLARQMELVAPELIVLLGGVAAKHLLDLAEGIMRVRGKWREINVGGRMVKTLATLHPAYLLRSPAAKRQAWRDFLAIKAALSNPPR